MAERNPPSWLQNDTAGHTAENDRLQSQGHILSSGLVDAGDLAVTKTSGNNWGITVGTGGAWIDGTQNTYQGIYHVYNAGAKTLTVTTADATNDRIDIVVARVYDSGYGGVTDNKFALEIVTGTPAATPSVPSTPANSLKLAEISVAAGASSISSTDITDKRYPYAPRTPTVNSNRYPLSVLGTIAYRNSNATTEGLELYHGGSTGWKAPWNLPWGMIAYVESTGTDSNISSNINTGTQLLTVSFTAVANRNYHILAYASFQSNWADDTVHAVIEIDDTTKAQAYCSLTQPNNRSGTTFISYRTATSLTAGTRKVDFVAARGAGAGTVVWKRDTFSPAHIMVLDIGPNSGPS